MIVKAVELALFEYDKATKTLYGIKTASEIFGQYIFPAEFMVRSHHTGVVTSFVKVTQDDPAYDEDHWDGEYQYYRPVKPLQNVKYAVLRAG